MIEKKKYVFVLTYVIVGALIIMGVVVMLGWLTKPEIHVFVHEFKFKEELGFLTLRFESSSGVFVTGEKIHVNALLVYPLDMSKTVYHLLYFPDALQPEEYLELVPKENFGKLIPDEEGVSIKVPQSKSLHNLALFPPTTEFDVIWTQDGPKDAVLIMDAKEVSPSKEELLKNGTNVQRMITIQPSDVRLQTQSNNVNIGLALIIIGITILTAFFGIERIWFLPKSNSGTHNDDKRKK